MEFEFDVALIAPKMKDDIYESFPHVFIFVKDVDGKAVVCDSDYLTGSQRFVENDKSYIEQYRFNPIHLKEKGSLSIKNGATHLITGYYDLIEQEFKHKKIFELKDTDDFYKNVINEILPIQYNEMWFNRQLFEANLKANDKLNIRLNLDTDEFNHVTAYSLYEFVVDYYKLNEFTQFKGHLHPTNLVKKMLSHFNVEDNPVNAFFAMQILTTSGYTDMIFYDQNKDDYDYMDERRGVLDMHVVFGGGEAASKIYPLVIMKERFIEIMK